MDQSADTRVVPGVGQARRQPGGHGDQRAADYFRRRRELLPERVVATW